MLEEDSDWKRVMSRPTQFRSSISVLYAVGEEEYFRLASQPCGMVSSLDFSIIPAPEKEKKMDQELSDRLDRIEQVNLLKQTTDAVKETVDRLDRRQKKMVTDIAKLSDHLDAISETVQYLETLKDSIRDLDRLVRIVADQTKRSPGRPPGAKNRLPAKSKPSLTNPGWKKGGTVENPMWKDRQAAMNQAALQKMEKDGGIEAILAEMEEKP